MLKNAKVYAGLDALIEGTTHNTMSLAVFKPSKISEFVVEVCDREWDGRKLEGMRAQHA